MSKHQIRLKLDENCSCLRCLLLLIWDQFMGFHMSTYTSTLPSCPCGIMLSDSSSCPDYLRLLWNPRIFRHSFAASQKSSHLPHLRFNFCCALHRHTPAVSWNLLAEPSSAVAPPPSLPSTGRSEHVREHVRQSFCPLQLTFLVMNVQQQSAQGAFRVRGLSEGPTHMRLETWWLPSSPPGNPLLTRCPPRHLQNFWLWSREKSSFIPTSADLEPNELQQRRGMCC